MAWAVYVLPCGERDVLMIEEQITECIFKQSPGARKRGVRRDEPLLQNGILDSLGVLELVSYLEQEFGIVVEDDDMAPENFQTIERIATFVTQKQNR
jgi:acyl carrier protein